MGKGYNNYMTKKFFHPGSKENIKRVWMAQQKDEFDKKKQEEMLAQYQREQETYGNRALLGDEKAKVGLSFMYDAPPGAKQEREKEDDEPEYKFEWQRKYNAPRESYAKDDETIRDQPFGIEVRNVRCIKCHKWGHVNTDKICPLYGKNITAEPPQPGSQPTSLVEDMQQGGLKFTNAVKGRQNYPHASNQQIVQSDDEDPEVQFLKSLTTKQKKKLLKKLDKLQQKKDKKSGEKKKKKKKKQRVQSSEETDSDSDEPKKKKIKRGKHKKKSKKQESSDDSDSDSEAEQSPVSRKSSHRSREDYINSHSAHGQDHSGLLEDRRTSQNRHFSSRDRHSLPRQHERRDRSKSSSPKRRRAGSDRQDVDQARSLKSERSPEPTHHRSFNDSRHRRPERKERDYEQEEKDCVSEKRKDRKRHDSSSDSGDEPQLSHRYTDDRRANKSGTDRQSHKYTDDHRQASKYDRRSGDRNHEERRERKRHDSPDHKRHMTRNDSH